MIKELIKLANHLDSRGFAKEADYLDGIIKESTSNLPQRSHSITGQQGITGCDSNDNSDYCKKLRESKVKFDRFIANIRNNSEHNKIWLYLTKNGLSPGKQQEWFEAIMAKIIPDPTAYNNDGDEQELDEMDLHNALSSLIGTESIKKYYPYERSGGLFGRVQDAFTRNEDREKNAYGEFLDSLNGAIN